MIYLIRSTYYDLDREEVIDLLKIGYTSSRETRFRAYNTSNPCHNVICTVEGDRVEEKRLHEKFSEYLYINDSEKFNCNYTGNEWFYYDDSIVDFIKMGDFSSLKETSLEAKRSEEQSLVSDISNDLSVDLEGLCLKELHLRKCQFQLNKTDYFTICRGINQMYPELFSKVDPVIISYLIQFSVVDKVMALCSVSEEDRNKFFTAYYHNCSERAKQSFDLEGLFQVCNLESIVRFCQNFKDTNLKSIRNSRFVSRIENFIIESRLRNLIADDVYSCFEVGQEYTSSFIVTKLKEIFEKLGSTCYEKIIPSDIRIWFDAKIIKRHNTSYKLEKVRA